MLRLQPVSFVLALLVLMAAGTEGRADQIPLTILHTNDVHSHYRPDKGPFGLGGIGRIATTIRRLRAATPNTLLLDGGDWSEGNIYYNLDPGRTSIEIMNALGYDAAVIGNHDWLNGPDQLLKVFSEVPPTFPILGANLNTAKYARAAEFGKYVTPYQILKVGGLKVAVIGLVTYELIYDKYFSPVEIKDPFGLTRKLATKLKQEADLVVVISHNGMGTNKIIAGLPGVDVVIHAHDHVKLAQPLVVEHNGKSAILVEAYQWGQYVGKLDLVVDTETKKYTVKNYELIQMDDTIPDDLAIGSLVNNYEHQIQSRYGGDIFHDHIADSTIDLRREGNENLYGNLLTDAYREATGADVSFEQVALTSSELHVGPLNTVDFFNALSAIYSPITGKSWTLKTVRMTGETLQWVLNFVLSVSAYIPGGGLSVSGIHAVYDPVTASDTRIADKDKQTLKSLEIGGRPLDLKKEYLIALPEGINEAIDFLEQFWGNKVPRTDFRDTGLEDWKVLQDYVVRHAPLDPTKVARGERLVVLQSDLGLYHDEVSTSRTGKQIWANVTIRNMGAAASGERKLNLTYDKTPLDTRDDPNPVALDNNYAVPSIAAGGKYVLHAALTLPEELAKVRVPLYFRLNEDKSDTNPSNDGTWVVVDTNGNSR